MTEHQDPIIGGCLCGAVSYEAEPPTLFCAHCHCRWCRRAHGAAFVTWFGVPEERFRLVEGVEDLRWYQSSKRSRRGFCGTCGTTLFFASTSSPGEMHIALATVDTPIDREPALHCFVDQKAPWWHIDDDLPTLPTDSPALAHYRD
ncbi:MAG: GFA family protein [Deltaproteobacteria bacterium]|nr:GFA family protein [Deltaproteobacteria bacterium]